VKFIKTSKQIVFQKRTDDSEKTINAGETAKEYSTSQLNLPK
jgi:hypothetical protein